MERTYRRLARPSPSEINLVRAHLRSAQTAFAESWARCTAARLVAAALLFVCVCGWVFVITRIELAQKVEERADVPSPRTPWSSRRASQFGDWHSLHRLLVANADAYRPATLYDARARLVLLGDSITEAWRGTSYGELAGRAEGVPSVLAETLARRWPKPMVLGISGDQTQHVLWRLAHGELSAAMAEDARLLTVLLIGTNNLNAGHRPEEVVRGIVTIAGRLLNQTRGRVLVNALLPRGDGARALPRLCPPLCAKGGKPLRSFAPAIAQVNSMLRKQCAELAAEHLAAEHTGRLRFADCGAPFVAPPPPAMRRAAWGWGSGEVGARMPHALLGGGGDDGAEGGGGSADGGSGRATGSWMGGASGLEADRVRLELMPDKLHPNAEGHRLWASCLEEALAPLDMQITGGAAQDGEL